MIVAQLVLIILLLYALRNNLNLRPEYVYAAALAVIAYFAYRYYSDLQRNYSIWRIISDIRTHAHKPENGGRILTTTNIHGGWNVSTYRSVLRHAVWVRFQTEGITYEYDTLAGRVVGVVDEPLNEIIKREQETELTEKLKTGEIVIAQNQQIQQVRA